MTSYKMIAGFYNKVLNRNSLNIEVAVSRKFFDCPIKNYVY